MFYIKIGSGEQDDDPVQLKQCVKGMMLQQIFKQIIFTTTSILIFVAACISILANDCKIEKRAYGRLPAVVQKKRLNSPSKANRPMMIQMIFFRIFAGMMRLFLQRFGSNWTPLALFLRLGRFLAMENGSVLISIIGPIANPPRKPNM